MNVARIEQSKSSLTRVLASICEQQHELDRMADVMSAALAAGNKILTCGNGGSAAQAQHFATELVGRYDQNRKSLPSLFLGADATLITCIANDFGWRQTFSRPLSSHATPGDVLVCFSTSGRSANVLEVLKLARQCRVASVALLGKGGGDCRGLADLELVVDSDQTARIQEAQLFIVHYLCDKLESSLFAAGICS